MATPPAAENQSVVTRVKAFFGFGSKESNTDPTRQVSGSQSGDSKVDGKSVSGATSGESKADGQNLNAPTTASSTDPVQKKEESKTTYYFPAPPIISTINSYQNVNNDQRLQDMETSYFLDKTLEYINYDNSWSKLKKFKKYLKGEDGYEIIHKILKLFVRRGDTNWYDLKVQQDLVMDFIKHKLTKLSKASKASNSRKSSKSSKARKSK